MKSMQKSRSLNPATNYRAKSVQGISDAERQFESVDFTSDRYRNSIVSWGHRFGGVSKDWTVQLKCVYCLIFKQRRELHNNYMYLALFCNKAQAFVIIKLLGPLATFS